VTDILFEFVFVFEMIANFIYHTDDSAA